MTVASPFASELITFDFCSNIGALTTPGAVGVLVTTGPFSRRPCLHRLTVSLLGSTGSCRTNGPAPSVPTFTSCNRGLVSAVVLGPLWWCPVPTRLGSRFASANERSSRAPVSPAVWSEKLRAPPSPLAARVVLNLTCALFLVAGRATSQAAWCAQPPGCTYRARRALWEGVFSVGRTTTRAPPRRCPTRFRPTSAKRIRAVGWAVACG